MRVEIDENTGWTTVACFIVVAALLAALGWCHITETTKREAIKAGLVEKQSQGSALNRWDKP